MAAGGCTGPSGCSRGRPPGLCRTRIHAVLRLPPPRVRGRHRGRRRGLRSGSQDRRPFPQPGAGRAGRVGHGRCLMYLAEITEGMALLDEAMVAATAAEVSPTAVGDLYCTVIEGARTCSRCAPRPGVHRGAQPLVRLADQTGARSHRRRRPPGTSPARARRPIDAAPLRTAPLPWLDGERQRLERVHPQPSPEAAAALRRASASSTSSCVQPFLATPKRSSSLSSIVGDEFPHAAGSLATAAHAELSQHRGDVVIDGLGGDVEADGDLVVRQVGAQQIGDLELAAG